MELPLLSRLSLSTGPLDSAFECLRIFKAHHLQELKLWVRNPSGETFSTDSYNFSYPNVKKIYLELPPSVYPYFFSRIPRQRVTDAVLIVELSDGNLLHSDDFPITLSGLHNIHYTLKCSEATNNLFGVSNFLRLLNPFHYFSGL